jgi:osmotically inducible protein OsmC
MIRKATAIWQGTGKEGKGHLSTQSNVLNKTQYSFSTRFEDGIGTNPEELIGAAHAGCFSMKLSFILSAAGFVPEQLETNCEITFENGSVTQSKLILNANVLVVNFLSTFFTYSNIQICVYTRHILTEDATFAQEEKGIFLNMLTLEIF